MLLHNLEEMSKLIGAAVINENDIIDGRYSYNDNNIGIIMSIMMHKGLLIVFA